jgi:predicted MFS family arabinose efflux permease
MIAPMAGKWADRRGVRWVLTAGISALAVSFVLLLLGERTRMPFAAHMMALVVGVVVLDLGAQLSQVGNQTRIFGLVPSARSRLNTVYMTIYFSGAAIGSAVASLAWVRYQWNGVCALALSFVALAGLAHTLGRREGAPPAQLGVGEMEERTAMESVLEV